MFPSQERDWTRLTPFLSLIYVIFFFDCNIFGVFCIFPLNIFIAEDIYVQENVASDQTHFSSWASMPWHSLQAPPPLHEEADVHLSCHSCTSHPFPLICLRMSPPFSWSLVQSFRCPSSSLHLHIPLPHFLLSSLALSSGCCRFSLD